MTTEQFATALQRIEEGREGSGYHVRLGLTIGCEIEGAVWTPEPCGLVRIDVGGDPDRQTYVDVATIGVIGLLP
jgi:hypothetical protein